MSLNYDLVCTQCGYELATGLRPGHVHPDEGRRLTQALLRGCPACDANGVKANFSVRLDLSQIQPPGRPGAARLVDPGAPGIWRWRTLLPVDPAFKSASARATRRSCGSSASAGASA